MQINIWEPKKGDAFSPGEPKYPTMAVVIWKDLKGLRWKTEKESCAWETNAHVHHKLFTSQLNSNHTLNVQTCHNNLWDSELVN